MKEKPNRISELRHKFGISQEKLAENLNVTQASVSLYENGSNIPNDILFAIAEQFQVSPEYLLKQSDSKYNIRIENLSRAEYDLLRLYRNLPADHRRLADKAVKFILNELTECKINT